MRSSHSLDRLDVAFDDDRLVADAGLLLPATLAHHLGLKDLVETHLDLGATAARANVGDKLLTLIMSALAGGDFALAQPGLRAVATAARRFRGALIEIDGAARIGGHHPGRGGRGPWSAYPPLGRVLERAGDCEDGWIWFWRARGIQVAEEHDELWVELCPGVLAQLGDGRRRPRLRPERSDAPSRQ